MADYSEAEDPRLEALRARQPAAFALLFEQHSHRIYRLALRLLQDERCAEEVVQDTFVRLIEKINTFEGRSSLETWLYRVAYNEALMRLRQQHPQHSLDDTESDALMPGCLVDWQQLPEQLVASAESVAELERALQTLSPALQIVFVLRDIEMLSVSQTAEIVGITESTVKVRLHRARLSLRETLSRYFSERLRSNESER